MKYENNAQPLLNSSKYRISILDQIPISDQLKSAWSDHLIKFGAQYLRNALGKKMTIGICVTQHVCKQTCCITVTDT